MGDIEHVVWIAERLADRLWFLNCTCGMRDFQWTEEQAEQRRDEHLVNVQPPSGGAREDSESATGVPFNLILAALRNQPVGTVISNFHAKATEPQVAWKVGEDHWRWGNMDGWQPYETEQLLEMSDLSWTPVGRISRNS